MRIFLYEFVAGGGWHHASPNEPPCGTLLAEARAMIQALATDLAALPENELVLLHDARLAPFDGIEERPQRFVVLPADASKVKAIIEESAAA